MNKDIEHSHHEFLSSTKYQIEMGLKILNLLFLSNAGAIVAFLGFLSHKANETCLSSFWFWGVVSFVIGLGCVLVAYRFSYFQQMALTIKYRIEYSYHKELENYNNFLITYNSLRNDPSISAEFLGEQLSFLEQQRSALQDRHQRIITPFSDCRLWWAVSFSVLSAICFLTGTILILLGF